MYKKFKDYFSISRQEYRGIMVVMLIFIVIYTSPYVYENFFHKPLEIKIQTLGPVLTDIDSFKNKYPQKSFKNYEEENTTTPVLFSFNPNHLPIEDWMKLGLTEKQAATIKKYEAKGGKFYKKEDLKKIYSISEKQYKRLEPYISITDNRSKYVSGYPSDKKYEATSKTTPAIIDINTADSSALLNIRGIGPAFASRIIKYRTKLGGFVRKEQLKEVYGLDSLKFQQIQNQVIIDKDNIKQIAINECAFEDLKRFPYLTYKQMNAIVAYRKQHGNYKTLADLNKIAILNSEIISKIEPYIKF